MRAMNFDSRNLVGVEVTCTHDILTRDQMPTTYLRASRAIVKNGGLSFELN